MKFIVKCRNGTADWATLTSFDTAQNHTKGDAESCLVAWCDNYPDLAGYELRVFEEDK